MRQRLGEKKTRRCGQVLGRAVRAAYTRGGWEHYWANVFCADGTVWWVNYRTGESEQDTATQRMMAAPNEPPK